MKALVLRLDAPMISFGGVIVDQHGFIERFPATSMLTGLIANALGWDHSEADKLQALQDRIDFAARWDVPPEPIVDYHTVDLSQPKMLGYATKPRDPKGGWTTRGVPDYRSGGSAQVGTHQRYRHYWVDGLMTLVLALKTEDELCINQVAEAIRRPARPLFLGRKTCLPARPLLDPHTPIVEGDDLLSILRNVPVWDRYGKVKPADPTLPASWPEQLPGTKEQSVRYVYDMRNWSNQLVTGGRRRAEGTIGEGFGEDTTHNRD